jgi:hypothetical protein
MPNISKIEFVFLLICNTYFERFHFFSLLKSVKPILVPIVWFDDEARIFPEIHSELSTLIVFLNIAYYIKFIFPSLSILFIVISSIFIFHGVRFDFIPHFF